MLPHGLHDEGEEELDHQHEHEHGEEEEEGLDHGEEGHLEHEHSEHETPQEHILESWGMRGEIIEEELAHMLMKLRFVEGAVMVSGVYLVRVSLWTGQALVGREGIVPEGIVGFGVKWNSIGWKVGVSAWGLMVVGLGDLYSICWC